MAPRLLAALLVPLAGCLDALAPSVGAANPACDNADSDPSTSVTYHADVVPLVTEYHCLRCHSATGATPIGLDTGGLDLTSYDAMRAGGVIGGDRIVVPGRPCESLLLAKLGYAPPFGSRMPGDGPPYLEDGDLQLISDWIAEGAHE